MIAIIASVLGAVIVLNIVCDELALRRKRRCLSAAKEDRRARAFAEFALRRLSDASIQWDGINGRIVRK